MSVRMRIALASVLSVLVLGTFSVLSYRQIQRLSDANRWVTHTHEVLETLDRVLTVLTDAETGQRGFLLTGEDRYLEPYNEAGVEIRKALDGLATLTADNPAQQAPLGALRALSQAKLAELDETIRLRRQAGIDAALPVVRSDRGKRIMDELRGIIAGMTASETRLLAERDAAARTVARQSLWAVTGGSLVAVLILAAATALVTRAIRFSGRGVRREQGAGRGSTTVRYLFAVAMVALASGLRWWLERTVGPMPLFITWYPAVLLVASIAGGGPGIAATVMSILVADYCFIDPGQSLLIGRLNDAVAIGIFAGTGIFLSVLAERLRRVRQVEAVRVAQEEELALLNKGNLMTLDLGHRIVSWSEGNRRLYGFDEAEAKGQITRDLLRTKFGPTLEEVHGQLEAEGYWEGEVTRQAKDGTILSVAVLWALRRDEDGKPAAILEVSTDLTRQKAAEESLRQQAEELAQQNEELSQQTEEMTQQAEELSEQNEEMQAQSEEIQALNTELGHRERMLQTLLDCARMPLGEKEVIGRICQAAMDMFGKVAAGAVVCERQGDHLAILASAGFDGAALPARWPLKGSFVEVVLQQNRTACMEDASQRPDVALLTVPGWPRFASVISSPLHVNGTPVGAVTLYSRATHRWTAEQFSLIRWLASQCSNTLDTMRLAAEVVASQKQNAFLASILERSSQAFGVGYPDGRLGLINPAFERLTGYRADELRSMDWARTLTPPEWVEMERKQLETLQRTGVPVRYEKEYIRKDGSRVPVELLVHLEKDADGKPQYYYSFLTDIAERKRAEEALREGEERLRFALETSHTGAWDLDLVDHTAFRSLEHDRIFGYPDLLPQWTYEMFLEHVLPEDRAMVDGKFQRAMETHGGWDFECRIRRADGQLRWIWAAGRQHTNAAGAARRMAGIVQDITERRAAEETVRQSEATLRGILNAAKESIWLFSAEGIILMANQTALARLGTTAEQAIGRHFGEFMAPELAQSRAARLAEAVTSRRPIETEDVRAGMVFQHSYYPVEDADGRLTRIACFSRDITERQRAEAALRESEARLRELSQRLTYHVDNSPLAVIEWGPDMRLTRWSGASERIFGWKADEVLGKRMEDFRWIYQEDSTQVSEVSRELVTGANPRRFSANRNYRKDGSIVCCEWYNSSLVDQSGALRSILSLVLDVTERTRAEESLLRTVAELERSNKELEQFAYVASHDLQEPLRQVRSFAQLLQERHNGGLDDKAIQYLRFVYDGAARMNDLVRGLLAYSRAGARDATRRPVACQQVFDAAMSNLQASIDESDARLTHDVLPTVKADATQLAQLFQNLVGNAIKFRREGEPPRVHVGCRREGTQWLFRVEDNGIGIEPEFYDRVFLIFQRLHNREAYPGTGIGLAICKKIVEQHGGKIWIESKRGEGSTFLFTLPGEDGL